MNESDSELENALASLRPRPPRPALVQNIARELDAPSARRGVIIAWTSGLAALAAAGAAVFLMLASARSPQGPSYELVRAEQSPAAMQLLSPVQLQDGSYARPVRVHWENTTRWEDPRTHTQLINYRPNEHFALLPLETY